MEAELVAKIIVQQATQAEKELFDKIDRSSEEKVFKEFGIQKDEILNMLFLEWIARG